MKLNEIGEFGFIERFKPWFEGLIPKGSKGIGDDCAIIPVSDSEYWVVTTDLLIEGVHFLKDKITPGQLGMKSLAVNLSDIAAMGATPVGSFLSIAVPDSVDVGYLDEFMKGYLKLSGRYNTALMGGDTTKSLKHFTVNVCVIGKCKKDSLVIRGGAKNGDVICVTGELGDSAGGLSVILNDLPLTLENNYLLKRHHLPEPRIDEGKFLASTGAVNAMMDISDGIASDLLHILKASKKKAKVDIDRLPISANLRLAGKKNNWNIEEMAVAGGEDYELICTVNAECVGDICDRYYEKFGKSLIPIGRIVEGEQSINWRRAGREVFFSKSGFNHFSKEE